ncbi:MULTISPECIES: MauE/DoxX family redox-associated membrane protein [Streptomyces]|uniref:MauE/DoxX family redox-associated membrane protein n=1 Tax=Streptomyces TaxID=1883 RepID=UPI001319E274|nr:MULTISPECIES: MauE/DoxX family redox-associated membrane protein [Streptomyces]MYT07980.1 hypothetical protein [Streptomyces sp. SID5470]
MNAVDVFGRLCLLATFAWSATPKIVNFADFRRHVTTTIPGIGFFASPLAASVIATELGASLCLMVYPLRIIGLAGAAFLLTSFTVYLFAVMRIRPGTSCGCVGTDGTAVSGAHLVRNLILLVACGVTWWATADSAGPSLSDYAVLAAPATAVAIAVLHLGELAALLRPAATD